MSAKGKIFCKKDFFASYPPARFCCIILLFLKRPDSGTEFAVNLRGGGSFNNETVYFVVVCGYYGGMSKTDFKRVVMWPALALVIALIVLTIYGAFVGTEHARQLFNCVPMQMFWFLITIALIASLILFPSLVKRPSLLLIHLGCIGILVGSIWASETGHRMQKQLFGKDKIRSGMMPIYEGKMTNKVILPQIQSSAKLSFEIGLREFRIEYYESPGPDGQAMPRDYLSDVSVIEDGKVVKRKTIEVNKPLHYGGYYFYQHSFEEQEGQYTVLAVVSDSGLFAVFAGYILLVVGLFWRCWLAPMMKER